MNCFPTRYCDLHPPMWALTLSPYLRNPVMPVINIDHLLLTNGARPSTTNIACTLSGPAGLHDALSTG